MASRVAASLLLLGSRDNIGVVTPSIHQPHFTRRISRFTRHAKNVPDHHKSHVQHQVMPGDYAAVIAKIAGKDTRATSNRHVRERRM